MSRSDRKESGSMPKETSTNHAVFSGVHEYFINNVLPENIQARVVHINSATSYTDNRDQTFMLIRSGSGKIVINGLEYSLKPNTLINLGPFHRYRFLPAKGKSMEIAVARMNCGTYMYMISNPYLKCDEFPVPSEPAVIYLKGLSAEIANDSMNGLLVEAKSNLSDRISLCFCYMTDLFGIIIDKIS